MRRRHVARCVLCLFLLLASPFAVDCRGKGLHQQRDGRRGDMIEVASQKKEPEGSQDSFTDFEALKKLHKHLDDDDDGEVEITESEEFISEELNQRSLSVTKGARLHRGNAHVTVNDLWLKWHHSVVYNWSCDEVVQWLVHTVHLPQYEEAFRAAEVNGTTLPRIAMNDNSFLLDQLKITSNTDRKKLQLRAMDLILFGPPTHRPRNWVLDVVLVSFAMTCALGLWWTCRQKHAAERQVDQMLFNMKKAEEELTLLQSKLESEPAISPRPKSPTATSKGQAKETTDGASSMIPKRSQSTPAAPLSVDALRAEVDALLHAKHDLEGEVEVLQTIPDQYYMLLQQTYRMEKLHWEEKKRSTEKELNTARTECEKLHRKKSFLNSLRVINSTALQDTDHKINRAIITLKEVTEGLEEFNERWRSIEYFSSMPISGAGTNHNGDSDSLARVSQERASVMGTPPSTRRRLGRVSTSAKPGHGRPPSIESTKTANSSQDSTQTDWSIGGDSLHSKTPENDFNFTEQTYHRYSSDGSSADLAARRAMGSQTSLPLHRTGSDKSADLGWYRSSAPNLQDLPSNVVGIGSSAKRLVIARSERMDSEELPPIIEASPVPSRSNSEISNGNSASSNFLRSTKMGRGGWKVGT